MRMRRAVYAMLVLLIVGGVACGADETSTPAASDSKGTPAASPSATSSKGASGCTEANATDLTADDPYTITVRHFRFRPDCFIPDFETASIAIDNKDAVRHTFTIDGTLVNAPLRPHHTYEHAPAAGILEAGTYQFHCSIHPKMTGTMIVE
jgi:plastocyanin